MGNMPIFAILLITVNALVTSLMVRGMTSNPKNFFLRWCGIILAIQLIAMFAAMLLPMDAEGVPFAFAFLAPIAVSAVILKKTLQKINKNKEALRTWKAVGITSLAQVLSWLSAFWFLPKYH